MNIFSFDVCQCLPITVIEIKNFYFIKKKKKSSRAERVHRSLELKSRHLVSFRPGGDRGPSPDDIPGHIQAFHDQRGGRVNTSYHICTHLNFKF